MAPNRMLAIFTVAIALVGIAHAKEFIVGDDKGWTLGIDYVAWAAGKEFYVGDTLVFNYPVGIHDVYRANITEFQGCIMPDNGVPLTSGKDNITLATPGNKWYFCGVGQDCVNGQKLKITVVPQMLMGTAPSPAPTSSANAISIGVKGMIAAVIAATAVIMA